MNNSTSFLTNLESDLKEKTGIPKLKIGYNKVFGYFIEVTNSYKNLVPDTFIRKQTLTNCERYITPELKEQEGTILGAKDRAVTLEYQLFVQIRDKVAENLERIQTTAKAIAQLDVLISFAAVAADMRYCRPEVNMNGEIIIKDGRHPVVEMLLSSDKPFVPNDVRLDSGDNRVAIITGPNMAGKSTYMRQTALIVLMAQMGSFVPAGSAVISVTDAIFTRVGASDDLASGQSTFMVEMNEVAQILKNATSQSLLILDEIGRGTSTFDGMSIARAVLEYVANKKTLGARTLFATHYHELTVLEELLDGVKNYNIAVKKRGDDITFLRRIVSGGADDSYGIEVAKLAGLPESVITRAKAVLKDLENGKKTERPKKKKKEVIEDEPAQMSLIEPQNSVVSDFVRDIDVNTLTPIEALRGVFQVFWIILSALNILMGAYVLFFWNDGRFSGLYFLALGGFCVFRAVRYTPIYKAQYKKLAEMAGGENWHRTVDLDDSGIITTDNSITVKTAYEEIKGLRENGNNIYLDTDKKGVIRLYKNCFTQGSYEEFRSLIKEKTDF